MAHCDFEVKVCKSMLDPKFQVTLPSHIARNINLASQNRHLTIEIHPVTSCEVSFTARLTDMGDGEVLQVSGGVFAEGNPIIEGDTLTFSRRPPIDGKAYAAKESITYNVSSPMIQPLLEELLEFKGVPPPPLPPAFYGSDEEEFEADDPNPPSREVSEAAEGARYGSETDEETEPIEEDEVFYNGTEATNADDEKDVDIEGEDSEPMYWNYDSSNSPNPLVILSESDSDSVRF